ncbi:DUF4139 domain-containing protein [Acidicapsa ligni]|uniref:DUF4139 domain-containing protein n=1 Tax=Acidicapsa ligni TaxID=542300 RepID=UPI0021DF51E2|nr:DUF4139 domain-containing protein [Acidicapsa ligni]
MRPLFSAALLFAAGAPCFMMSQTPATLKAAAPKTAEPAATAHGLPVRQVVLYKNGVGYFEHTGSVSGNQRVTIDFTSSQLNDVLQSLTVLDEGGGRIAGVNYNSTTPLAEQLKSLSLGMSDDPSSTELFQSLRGQRVEVSGGPGGVITGRLMSIETRTEKAATGDATVDKSYLTLISTGSAVRVIELTPTLSVRPLDASLQGQLDRYLELLSTTHATGLRHLTLDALGQGQRQLRVSYISEVPVWKSTYRIVFPNTADGNAILQGWAVVDNTIGADWDNVQLSLVAGAPQSFIQPLSQPLYLRRPEVPISTTAMTTPQTHEAAEMREPQAPVPMEQMTASMNNRLMAPKTRMNPGVAGMEGTGSGVGGGISSGAAGGVIGSIFGGGGGGVYRPSDAIQQGDVSANAFDDFFQYTLAQPVTIHKNESAMVPILQEKLPAERVTLWSQTEPHPFRALWLENTSKLTFDSGSFSVFESGTFAGEGLLDPIHPGEKRLISYASDQAVRVRETNDENKREIREVHIYPNKGNPAVIQKKYGVQGRSTFTVSNSADEARIVVLELPRRGDRTLTPESKPTETAANLYRFKIAVPAHQSAKQQVGDEGTEYESWEIQPDADQVGALQSLTEEVPALLDQLKPIYMAQHEIQEMQAQIQQSNEKIISLTADEARARENLTALKGNDAARRFVDELNRAEDELQTVRKQNTDLQEKRKASVESLRQTLLTLTINWTSSGN